MYLYANYNDSFVMVDVGHHRYKIYATILSLCELHRFNELCNLNRLRNIVMACFAPRNFRTMMNSPLPYVTLKHARPLINMYGRSTSISRFREINDRTCLLLWKLNAWSVTNAKIYAKVECIFHFFTRDCRKEKLLRAFLSTFFF